MPARRIDRLCTERGASAVEFALVAVLLFMVVFGMISGGLAYARKISITDAAREGVRYGATLPIGTGAVPDAWLDEVAARVLSSASGNLAESWDGQYVCVAYVGYGSPRTSSTDVTRKREKSGTNAAVYTNGAVTNPSSWCFDDGRGTNGSERRVQVVARRSSKFEAVLWSSNLTLSGDGVARFEAVVPG
ncbi:MAG: TadE/TadG family type IV pilus assembly protein [Actinomycetota bacterium]